MQSNVENPWTRQKRTKIYQNPWITLYEDAVLRPDGQPGIYSVIETRIATGVVALTEDLKVYLVGQYRYPTDMYSWEIVEGGTDDGESALAAAQRELREEAGLVAEEWQQLGGEIHLSNCISSERGVLYLARGLREVGSQPDGTEVLALKTVTLDDCFSMLDRGEFVDSLSIIALHRIDRMLQQGMLK